MSLRVVLALLGMFFVQLLFAQGKESGGDYIRLVDALDEAENYCLDLAGWSQHLQLDDPMQTHTCKTRDGDDQIFQFADGKLKVSLYDRCVQVAGSNGVTLAGAAVIARPCSDNPLQIIALDDSGRLRVNNSQFCIGAGADSTEASGPSHMWRTLVVVGCDTADKSLSTWRVGLN
jgi:hypothetical protein